MNNNLLVKLNNKKIGVLYGGISSERDISIKSGKAILNALNNLGLNACGIDINKDIIGKIIEKKIDIAYIALHGNLGEDGKIQGMLEVLGIPYTGCGVLASSVFMNKDVSKKLFEYVGVLTPSWIVINNFNFIPKIDKYPVVVKPVSHGSAIGITIVDNQSKLSKSIEKAFEYDKKIIIEQFIEGKEITVGIVNGYVLPIIEIVPVGEFYDFESKYGNNGSKHIIPARITEKASKIAKNNAKILYETLECKGACRFDMIVDSSDNVWVLENNTIPGMTKSSLLPDAGMVAGYNFEHLVLKILESAF